MRHAATLALALALGACDEPPLPPCPDGGTALTWEGFGRPFLEANCDRCHRAGTMDRQGAPWEFAFDTLDDARRHRDRLFARAATTRPTMPPGPDKPGDAERARLAEWLSCLPGPD